MLDQQTQVASQPVTAPAAAAIAAAPAQRTGAPSASGRLEPPADRLGATLQRVVRDRVPVLQRMRLQNGAPIDTLVDLNATLAGFGNLVPGATPPLPWALAAFTPLSSAARVGAAIQQSGLTLTDYMEADDVVGAVDAILAVPRPPAAARFDNHGWKHFGGGNGVKSGGDQWSIGKDSACTKMLAEIRRIEPHLRAHPAPTTNATTLFYYTTLDDRNVGKADGKLTTKYSIQIDYHVDDNTVMYHGYPDAGVVPLGLGHGKAVKAWPAV